MGCIPRCWELADVTARPPTAVFERSCQPYLQEIRCGQAQASRSLARWGEQILLETISKQMKDKKVTGNSHHKLIKGKPCLIVPILGQNDYSGRWERSSCFILTSVKLLSQSPIRFSTGSWKSIGWPCLSRWVSTTWVQGSFSLNLWFRAWDEPINTTEISGGKG